jgi:hypothetical protein
MGTYENDASGTRTGGGPEGQLSKVEEGAAKERVAKEGNSRLLQVRKGRAYRTRLQGVLQRRIDLEGVLISCSGRRGVV